MFIRLNEGWKIPEQLATPEAAYLNRRTVLKALGITGMGMMGNAGFAFGATEGTYPAKRNPDFILDRPLTDEKVAGKYNNFYEFTTVKEEVYQLAEKFETHPWQIEVSGEVDKKKTYDVDDLIGRMPMEERLYRFRCVEAWAMAVPWTGFPLKHLIKEIKPKSTAKFVRMLTFLRPDTAPGQKEQPWYPWPYYEALTMEEAMNDLTMLVTGIYGHELPKQHGAPIRLITPWKYGYKSIKSIVSIEFTRKQPPTFWNKIAPLEYDFYSNVNPVIPHPRWSQATERLIDTGNRVPTKPFNGYGEYVAHLYV